MSHLYLYCTIKKKKKTRKEQSGAWGARGSAEMLHLITMWVLRCYTYIQQRWGQGVGALGVFGGSRSAEMSHLHLFCTIKTMNGEGRVLRHTFVLYN